MILVNSNPATIMTDPEFADATYVEPITPEVVEAIIAKERPDAVLATLGGQTALNTAIALHETGVLDKKIDFREYTDTRFSDQASIQTPWKYEAGIAAAQ